MLNFKTLVLEARSAPLYHAIRLDHFIQAIASDKIVARGKHIHPDRMNWDRGDRANNIMPGTSTTRSLRYAKTWGKENGYKFVVIEFDQIALAANNKIIPMNYIANSNRAFQLLSPYYNGKVQHRDPARPNAKIGQSNATVNTSEYEEYVVGDIKNLDAKIVKIHVFSPDVLQSFTDSPLEGDERIVRHF